MWPLFLGTDTPAPLMLPDSVQKANFAETVHKIANLDFETVLQNLLSESVWILLKIALALAIYFIGRWILRRIVRLLDLALEHRRVDISLRSFMRNTVRVIFTLLLVLIVVSTLGVNVTSLIAVFSAATLAIGMALSGTAQNFAGGVMILLMKPYRVGDYISAQGQSGTVREIKLFSTVITTADNQTIYIPNNSIATAIIDNFSTPAVWTGRSVFPMATTWMRRVRRSSPSLPPTAACWAILRPWCGSRPLPTARSTSLREPG